MTVKIGEKVNTSNIKHQEELKFLCDLYEQSFGLANLPPELIFRLAHIHINHDQNYAIKLILDRINSKLDDETYHYLINIIQIDAPLINIDSLISIGNSMINFHITEPIRKFWNTFFDILLEKTSAHDVVQYYSDIVRQNANLPYLHLFEVIIYD